MHKRGRGDRMQYAVASSPLGPMLVARTAAGLCAVAFADDEADIVGALRERFPEAHAEAAELSAELRAVLAHLASNQPAALPTESLQAMDLPIQSPFHLRAWAAMQTIPRGETRTYRQLAEELGCPGGQVAVGAACAANPIAVLIPCHRVVAADGRLHGYRWGLERKRLLLALERGEAEDPVSRSESGQGRLAFGG